MLTIKKTGFDGNLKSNLFLKYSYKNEKSKFNERRCDEESALNFLPDSIEANRSSHGSNTWYYPFGITWPESERKFKTKLIRNRSKLFL